MGFIRDQIKPRYDLLYFRVISLPVNIRKRSSVLRIFLSIYASPSLLKVFLEAALFLSFLMRIYE
ncbi:MAG: hypothetical protein BWY84_01241 [Candidatus Aerophobetes bacterium ADurb.Bin490]|nr:MAG: hypothetical protein BWY84_01241 [Candidatus Aerophobetes bacterium ADurb.Bin490]